MYPKRMYAATGGSVTVEDKWHEKALSAEGWSENPPAPKPVVAAPPAPKPPAPPAPKPAEPPKAEDGE